MDKDFCCLTAETKTLTVECFFIMVVTDGSMKVRLAKAAEDKSKVSAELVFLDKTKQMKKIVLTFTPISHTIISPYPYLSETPPAD